ncbi:MAG: CBS domain-containing protein [Actinomycetota bacterium]|nr:CBS domain-containing protein [Actinomycetota bacterium]
MQLAAILASKGEFIATITQDRTVADVVRMLSEFQVGALVVSSDGSTISGIVSERDVVRALAANAGALNESVASSMTYQVYCAPPDASVDDLMHLMTDRRIRHVPITDAGGLLLGIVSIGDVVKSRLGELEGERAALLDYITRGG